MELLITIAFFIMLLSILAVLIYFIYDYISYKEAVDKTIEIINSSNLAIETSINTNRSAIDTANTNINTQDKRNTANALNIQTTSGDLLDFNRNIKSLLQFSSNGLPINDEIFTRTFSTDPGIQNYRINLMRRVNALSGMTIESSTDKGLKICHQNSENCVNLNMRDNNNMEIAPAGEAGYMTIKSPSASLPLAKFDFANNNIYFGGSNTSTSPMYLQNNQVFLDDSKLNIKLPNGAPPVKLNNVLQQNARIIDALGTINQSIWQSYSNLEVLVDYKLTTTGTTNALEISLTPIYDMPSGTQLSFSISASHIGSYIGSAQNQPTTTLNENASGVAASISYSAPNNIVTITFTNNVLKHKFIKFTISGTNIFSSPPANGASGTTVATRQSYPSDYYPRLNQNKIDLI